MKKPSLPVQIIIGLILGILWALLSSTMGWSEFTLDWIAPFGTIFINLLKLIAIPLVLFSIIAGIGNLSDTATLGRMGVKTLLLYIGSTVLAASMGMVIANTFNPGKQTSEEQLQINRVAYELWVNDTEGVEFFDDLRLLSDPAMQVYMSDAQAALAEQLNNEELNAKVAKANAVQSAKNDGPLQFFVDMVPSNIFLSFNDSLMLQVIFFAIFFGIVLVMLPNTQMAPVANLMNALSFIFIKMVDVVMKGAPIFVFALLAGKLAAMAGDEPGRLIEIFKALGAYTGYTILGLLFMILVLYPTILAYLINKKTGMGYMKSWGYFMRGIRPAQLLAFSTSSTAATLPVTMDCVRDNLGVDEEIGSFVLPVGATINMDGTALYQTVAVIFMAQFHMIDLTLAQQATIIFTATLASIGAASVPSAGMIMLIPILESVGLNPAWIAIIFPVDRIIDMVRTVLNLTGDASVSTIIALTEDKFHVVNQEDL
ncbi:MAG: dicarboxylate/amino acid:cation symporter [Flavobacteriales bacterium]|tara:strand:+ start:1757 stop:3208 length:1452 start_codon:yes stop_codon:yes gene_type:complete